MFRKRPPTPRDVPADPQPPAENLTLDGSEVVETAGPNLPAVPTLTEDLPPQQPEETPGKRRGWLRQGRGQAGGGQPAQAQHGQADAAESSPPTLTESPPSQPAAKPLLIPLSAFPSTRRIRPWVWWTAGSVSLVGGLLAASWFLLPVKEVQVMGNSHLSAAEVKGLAGLQSRMGWLYYGKRQARGLSESPWVQSAVVTRKFPDTVVIEVREHKPFLKAVQPDGSVAAVSEDGHLLKDAAGVEKLPSVTGWGPSRLPEAVLVARALSRYTVESVAFTPSGITVKTAAGTVWSGDPKSLVKYAGSISMYSKQKINVYPWGVSVQ